MNMTSLNGKTDFFSLLAKSTNIENPRQHLKNVVKNSFDFVTRYLSFLPPIDQDIARFYYLDGMSQDQIKKLFGVCQAAISRRVKFIFVRIKFLLRAPSLNPIQVREELRTLFDDSLFEFACIFYWELAQNRVKYYIETSQSGAANKLLKIIEALQEMSQYDENSKDPDWEKKKYLALVYLDYFQFIHKKSNVITFVFKRSDKYKPNSIVTGKSIFED
jgi:hypothetical protein